MHLVRKEVVNRLFRPTDSISCLSAPNIIARYPLIAIAPAALPARPLTSILGIRALQY